MRPCKKGCLVSYLATSLRRNGIIVILVLSVIAYSIVDLFYTRCQDSRDRAVSVALELAADKGRLPLDDGEVEEPSSPEGPDKISSSSLFKRMRSRHKELEEWRPDCVALCAELVSLHFGHAISVVSLPDYCCDLGDFLSSDQVQDQIRDMSLLASLGEPFLSADTIDEAVYQFLVVRMSDVVCADARLRYVCGDIGRALDELAICLRVANILFNEPDMAVQSCGGHIVETVFASVHWIPGCSLSSSASLSSLWSALPDLSDKSMFVVGIARASTRSVTELRKLLQHDSMVGYSNNPAIAHWMVKVYKSRIGRPLLNMDEQMWAEYVVDKINAAPLSFYETTPVLHKWESKFKALVSWRMLKDCLFEDQDGEIQSRASYEALVSLLRVGILLHKYRGARGHYPSTLESVFSDMGVNPLKDPFSGRPFVYKVDSDQVELSSVDCHSVGRSEKRINLVWRSSW